MTTGAFNKEKGICKLSVDLPSEWGFLDQDFKVIIRVDNSDCQKRMSKMKVKLVRNMQIRGYSINKEEKIWRDLQELYVNE